MMPQQPPQQEEKKLLMMTRMSPLTCLIGRNRRFVLVNFCCWSFALRWYPLFKSFYSTNKMPLLFIARHNDKKIAWRHNSKNLIDTLAPSEETLDLQLWKQSRTSLAPTDTTTAAAAYWNQVVPYLKEWDTMLVINPMRMMTCLFHTKVLPPASLSYVYSTPRSGALGTCRGTILHGQCLGVGNSSL